MKTFPLTPSGFNALRSRLLAQGITIPSGTDGTIEQNGITLKYHYDPEAAVDFAQQTAMGVLTLSIQKKPMFIPSAMIWSTVEQWLAS